MKSIVVYQSRHGNTEKIARAIAEGLERGGPVEVYPSTEAPVVVPEDVDLFVVGGPTEAHGITEPMAAYLDSLSGMSAQLVAAFDTRMRWPRWLSGSAAVNITKRLQMAGANEVARPMSFFVSGANPVLEPGELERAEAWGASLLEPTRETVDPTSAHAAIAATAATTAAVNAVVLPHAK
jgi:flavodoxin